MANDGRTAGDLIDPMRTRGGWGVTLVRQSDSDRGARRSQFGAAKWLTAVSSAQTVVDALEELELELDIEMKTVQDSLRRWIALCPTGT